MVDATGHARWSYVMPASTVWTLVRVLATQGLSEDEIRRGVDYAEAACAGTVTEGFVLAMSRILLSDAELAAGVRFTLE